MVLCQSTSLSVILRSRKAMYSLRRIKLAKMNYQPNKRDRSERMAAEYILHTNFHTLTEPPPPVLEAQEMKYIGMTLHLTG